MGRLRAEKHQLETASDLLKQLTERLNELTNEITEKASQLDQRKEQRTRNDEKRSVAQTQYDEIKTLIDDPDNKVHEDKHADLENMRREILADQQITIESSNNREQEMRGRIQALIDNEELRLTKIREKIVQAMSNYANAYRLETQEARRQRRRRR